MKTSKYQVTATELSALLNHSLNHVIHVCLLKLMLQGDLRNVSKNSKKVKLKAIGSPYIRYQRCLAKYYKKPRYVADPIKGDISREFLRELFQRMKRLGVFQKKGFFLKKWRATQKGKSIIQLNRNRLSADKVTLKSGLNVKLLRAFAIDPSYKKLLGDRFKGVCRVRVHGGPKQKDWFHATWAEANRYEANRRGVSMAMGAFNLY